MVQNTILFLIFLSVISAWSVLIYICLVIHMYLPVAFHLIIKLLCKHIYTACLTCKNLWNALRLLPCQSVSPLCYYSTFINYYLLLFYCFSSINRNVTMKINIHLHWSQVSSEISNSIPYIKQSIER